MSMCKQIHLICLILEYEHQEKTGQGFCSPGAELTSLQIEPRRCLIAEESEGCLHSDADLRRISEFLSPSAALLLKGRKQELC